MIPSELLCTIAAAFGFPICPVSAQQGELPNVCRPQVIVQGLEESNAAPSIVDFSYDATDSGLQSLASVYGRSTRILETFGDAFSVLSGQARGLDDSRYFILDFDNIKALEKARSKLEGALSNETEKLWPNNELPELGTSLLLGCSLKSCDGLQFCRERSTGIELSAYSMYLDRIEVRMRKVVRLARSYGAGQRSLKKFKSKVVAGLEQFRSELAIIPAGVGLAIGRYPTE